MQPPDLLEPQPRIRLDERLFWNTLSFAFATGSTPEAFERVLGSFDPGPTSYSPDHFARDLFCRELVERCLCSSGKSERYPLHRRPLLSLLTHPSSKLETLRFRQQILQAFASDAELEQALRRAWSELRYLFESFQSSERARHGAAVLRRLDLLRALHTTLERIEQAFGACSSGPLSRIGEFLREVQATDGFAHLESLLDYESNLATVDLRVRLGHDGEIRGFSIQRVDENQKNPWYASPLQRFFARLSLRLRGYRVRSSELLGRLVEGVFDEMQPVWLMLYQLMLDFEVFLAALRFRELAAKHGLQVCLPELSDASPNGARASSMLEQLFNPFLLLEPHPPVPCDLEHGPETLTIVTGPNSGGKTRLLQAVGLAQLLAQTGLFVPARRARLALRPGMFVSIVQQAEPEQSEGRLGTELVRIRRLFENLPIGGLAILDELCSGTNPREGEELFELLLELLGELAPAGFISTHFLDLAERLQRERPLPLAFLEVELGESGGPTYRFVPGVAKTSLATGVAERLGVTRDKLRALLRARRGELEAQRSALEQAKPPASGFVRHKAAP
jgi:DNA mismatch repair protein MutS2